jgi:hypothetical protein
MKIQFLNRMEIKNNIMIKSKSGLNNLSFPYPIHIHKIIVLD